MSAATLRFPDEGNMVIFTEADSPNFTWTCPQCRRGYYGLLADEPKSGWEDPRWKLTGPDEAPTLEPSLGCRGLLDGTCPGHYFFRNGKLVSA